ncbi:MAG: MoxR family ATPase, partial [Oscillospiraceae bacterium]
GELSTKSIDLRGLLSAIGVIRLGIAPRAALDMGLANKSFDGFEKDIIEDVMTTRIPQAWKVDDVFE